MWQRNYPLQYWFENAIKIHAYSVKSLSILVIMSIQNLYFEINFSAF